MELPPHVAPVRRDGRREVLLHRSTAFIKDGLVEIKPARSTILLPVIGLGMAAAACTLLVSRGNGLPFWLLVLLLLFCLAVVPLSVMSLIGSVVGAQVVVDAKKGSATWQQGYLGMGIGTKELVPFAKIDHLEVTIEGDQPDRWQDETDSLRQFALVLVKQSGKRLTLAQVPVPAADQADGMDRTLAVANAVSAITGAEVRLPAGWELVEIDTETGHEISHQPEKTPKRRPARSRR